jgi:hypothetical protein
MPMLIKARLFRIRAFPSILLVCFICSISSSEEINVRLPAGVEVVPLRAEKELPEGFETSALLADWTRVNLKPEIRSFEQLKSPVPQKWDLFCNGLSGICIQLIEPRESPTDGWEPALPWVSTEDTGYRIGSSTEMSISGREKLTGSWIALGQSAPWLPAGERINREPEWLSPLSGLPEAVLVGVRWMGRAADLANHVPLESFKRCLISVTSPARGSTVFIMIRWSQPGQFNLADIRAWLDAETDDDEWIALHSTGDHTAISTADWDMPLGLRDASVKRLGVALHLFERIPHEINLTRGKGVRISASSFERDFPPTHIADGHYLHHPLEPRLWISRPWGKDSQPWIEIEFPDPRKVSRVRLIWAGVAGWSHTYNPGQVRLLASEGWSGALREMADIINPEGPVFDWEPPVPVTIKRLKARFDKPSGDSLDTRARLSALEVWE